MSVVDPLSSVAAADVVADVVVVPAAVVSSSLESFFETSDFSDPSLRRCSRRSRSQAILLLCQSTTDELRNLDDASDRDLGRRSGNTDST